MESATIALPRDAVNSRDRNLLAVSLASSDLFRNYQRSFQVLTSLPLDLQAPGSFQLSMQDRDFGSAFCRMLAARSKTCAAYLNAQDRLAKTARDGTSTLSCFAGIHESAVPIRIGQQVVAYLTTGQVLFHHPTALEARKAARDACDLDSGCDRMALEIAYRQSRVVDRNQYDSLLCLLEIFAQELSVFSNELMIKQNLFEEPAVRRARAFITEHVTEDLSLARVSRAVGMSSFYFCKKFKEVTGLTFTVYLSRLRVEAVKQLLLNPYKRVSEAAYEAGFQSLSQFNRVFSRVAGEAPSNYRGRIHHPAKKRVERLVAA